jgi:TolB-like protein/Tfp pilus assembly protein PilF
MNPRNLFAELKRRNVIRMAGLYLVGAWLLTQIASTILPLFGAPEWLPRSVVILLAIGFIPALVFAWVFELTPEGFKLDEDVPAQQSIAPQTARRMDRVIIVVLVLALAYFCFDKFVLTPQREAALIATAGAPNEHKTATDSKSLAVLPLVNESGEKDEQYFSDGLSEDLITALSQFAGLKVIGRNSSFQFRDSKESSETIGAKLGVAHLLEGSVRRAADVVRISAELVNATDGSTLWSRHYDRPYKDLFKLQDDITTAVASALKAKLLNAPDVTVQSDRPPSGNLAAYNAYLQGQFYFARDTAEDYRKAIASYKDAIALDPQYALAYARLALTETFFSEYSRSTAKQNLADAREAVDRALALDPDLSGAHSARGLLLLFTDIDVAGTEAEFKRAVQLAPNDANAIASLAQARAALGHPEAAIEPIRRAIAADPLSANWYSLLEDDLIAVGRLDEAEAAVRRELTLHASNGALARLSTIDVLRGKAAAALEKAEQVAEGKSRDFALANARQIGSNRAAADAALKTAIDRQAKTNPYLISRLYALRNDPKKVFEWLDRAWAERDSDISILYYDPFLLRYKSDPRFAAFCKMVGLPTPAEVAASSKA